MKKKKIRKMISQNDLLIQPIDFSQFDMKKEEDREKALNLIQKKKTYLKLVKKPVTLREKQGRDCSTTYYGIKGKKNQLIPEELIADVLKKCNGMRYRAAKKLGVSVNSLIVRIKNSPFLLDIVTDLEEKMMDTVETKWRELIEAGDWKAMKHYIRCKGASRGFVEIEKIEDVTNKEQNVRLANLTDSDLDRLANLPDVS